MIKTENRVAGPLPCDPDLLESVADYAWFQASKNDQLTADDADDIAQITSEIILSRPGLWRLSAADIRANVTRSAVRLHIRRQKEKLTAGGDEIIDGDSVCRHPDRLPDTSRAAADVRDDLKIRIQASKLRRNPGFMAEQLAGSIVNVLNDVCDELDIDGETPIESRDDPFSVHNPRFLSTIGLTRRLEWLRNPSEADITYPAIVRPEPLSFCSVSIG